MVKPSLRLRSVTVRDTEHPLDVTIPSTTRHANRYPSMIKSLHPRCFRATPFGDTPPCACSELTAARRRVQSPSFGGGILSLSAQSDQICARCAGLELSEHCLRRSKQTRGAGHESDRLMRSFIGANTRTYGGRSADGSGFPKLGERSYGGFRRQRRGWSAPNQRMQGILASLLKGGTLELGFPKSRIPRKTSSSFPFPRPHFPHSCGFEYPKLPIPLGLIQPS